MRLQRYGLRQCGENSFCHYFYRMHIVNFREHYGKFVTAQSGDLGGPTLHGFNVFGGLVAVVINGVVFAQLQRQPFRNLHQQAVTAAMPNGIINAFEMIQVDKEQGGARALALASAQNAVELPVKAASVGQ